MMMFFLQCDRLDTDSISDIRNKLDKYCKRHGYLGWFKTSAKENIGIDEAVRCLVAKVISFIIKIVENLTFHLLS